MVKENLKQIITGCLVAGSLTGCAGLWEASDPLMQLPPTFLQPGGYKDWKAEQERERLPPTRLQLLQAYLQGTITYKEYQRLKRDLPANKEYQRLKLGLPAKKE